MTHVFNNAVDGMITSVKACTDTIAVTLTAADPVAEGHIELFTPYNRADRVFTRVGRIAGKLELLITNYMKIYMCYSTYLKISLFDSGSSPKGYGRYKRLYKISGC